MASKGSTAERLIQDHLEVARIDAHKFRAQSEHVAAWNSPRTGAEKAIKQGVLCLASLVDGCEEEIRSAEFVQYFRGLALCLIRWARGAGPVGRFSRVRLEGLIELIGKRGLIDWPVLEGMDDVGK